MLPAGFFDLGDNGFDLGDLSALLGFVVTLTAAAYGASRWANRSLAAKMAAVIDKRTQPIQSDANGGWSLPDVARNVDLLIERQTSIGKELVDLRTYNEAAHQVLTHKVDTVANRLDDHASSPVHDRRQRQTDVPHRRRTDDKE